MFSRSASPRCVRKNTLDARRGIDTMHKQLVCAASLRSLRDELMRTYFRIAYCVYIACYRVLVIPVLLCRPLQNKQMPLYFDRMIRRRFHDSSCGSCPELLSVAHTLNCKGRINVYLGLPEHVFLDCFCYSGLSITLGSNINDLGPFQYYLYRDATAK